MESSIRVVVNSVGQLCGFTRSDFDDNGLYRPEAWRGILVLWFGVGLIEFGRTSMGLAATVCSPNSEPVTSNSAQLRSLSTHFGNSEMEAWSSNSAATLHRLVRQEGAGPVLPQS